MNLEVDTLPSAKTTVTTKVVTKIVQTVNQQALCLLFSYKLQFYLIQGSLAKLPVPGSPSGSTGSQCWGAPLCHPSLISSFQPYLLSFSKLLSLESISERGKHLTGIYVLGSGGGERTFYNNVSQLVVAIRYFRCSVMQGGIPDGTDLNLVPDITTIWGVI